MVYGPTLNTNNSIYAQKLSPMMSNPFEDSFSFNLPFTGMDFSQYLNGDFMSTFQLFDMMMMGNMPKAWQGGLIDTSFNTKTDLAALKHVYNPSIGNNLANIANKNALQRDTVGKCYRGVKDSLAKAGLNNGELTGGSAWQAKGVLSKHKNFQKVDIAKNDLKNLPAGCVIVWDPYSDRKGKLHQHGHIAVTLGNGKEASDHVQNLVIAGNYTVFVPKGLSGKA